jgi:lipopolysaccharide/colanic/teichoic acid biosynthesis glycosyltransferase
MAMSVATVSSVRSVPRVTAGWRFVPVPRRRVQEVVKRALDVVAASLLLVIAAPIVAVVAIAIRIDSRGPIFFGQTRIGRDLHPFRIWKFRSMVNGAEEVRPELDRAAANFPLFKVLDDPRVTRVGRALRHWSLDELPQLWNVVRGDMSLVGPRPPLPDEVAADGLRQALRLGVRPGVTGLWQVNGRCELSYAEGVALDLAYTRHWSLAWDVAILARTPWAVLNKRGAH